MNAVLRESARTAARVFHQYFPKDQPSSAWLARYAGSAIPKERWEEWRETVRSEVLALQHK